MDERESDELPIFELGLAIVPGEQVPLHIFEPRYRAMIAHCLDASVPFGIVYRDDDGPRSIGCTALVSDVAERYEDGRLDIVVTGARPFRVLDRYEAADWPAAQIEILDAEELPATPGEELAAARTAFAELLEEVGAQPERAAAAPGAFAIGAQIEMPPPEKQALLESADEVDRLISLETSLRKLIAGVKRSRELAKRAQTNGHSPGRIGPVR
jgi:Lon protease-like protein